MNLRLWTVVAVIATAMNLGGCAFTPHDLRLQPATAVAPSTVGAGTSVYFRFVDERDDTSVGVRAASGVGSAIKATDLPTVMETQLRRGLETKGYRLTTSDQGADDTVTFRMRSFKFAIETGFWSGSDNVSAVLAVDALRGGQSYTNVYRFNSEHSAQVIPGADELDEMMNRAMNDLLQKALSDDALDRFLTHKG